MIRALFRAEPADFRDVRRVMPKVMAELGVEPLDSLRKRLQTGRPSGERPVRAVTDGTRRRAA